MTITMTSIEAHLYAGKRLKAGEQFECRGESDARVLRALGRAIDYTPPPPVVYAAPAKKHTPPGKYSSAAAPPSTEMMDAWLSQDEAKPDKIDVTMLHDSKPKLVDDPGRVKRAYRRRDLKAEE